VATPQDIKLSLSKALKGRNSMSPFQGLMNKVASLPVALPQALILRPFRAFMECSNGFLFWLLTPALRYALSS
jgi:hypothetical protein